jgi:hypothetical protein
MKIKYILIIISAIIMQSCSKEDNTLNNNILKWSKSKPVVQRKHPAAFDVPQTKGKRIVITTAYSNEIKDGINYHGGEILKYGFLVYPEEHYFHNIEGVIKFIKQQK